MSSPDTPTRNDERRIELTPDGEQELDWQRVVDLKPQGYLELNDTKNVIHGPVANVSIDEGDNVVIELRWAAIMPTPGNPGFGKWKNVADKRAKKVMFPNLLFPFVIENTPVKGPRVQFGFNILYINKLDGLDPSRVEGLKLD